MSSKSKSADNENSKMSVKRFELGVHFLNILIMWDFFWQIFALVLETHDVIWVAKQRAREAPAASDHATESESRCSGPA